MKTFTKRHEALIDDLVRNLCLINDTSGILPHMVFIEDEGEDEDGNGIPEYFRYELVEIRENGDCTLIDPNGNRTDEYTLRQINVDWLLTLWNWHIERLIDSGSWREDAIGFLQQHTNASLDDIVDFCGEYWQNLLPYTENLKAFHKHNQKK